MKQGFTLIEMSIVLIIIGLIVGGILTGQDLINAATQRAQIAQIEKYQTAVHTFQTKYNRQLPGDISDPDATRFGFTPRGTFKGMGDGNGVIEGITGTNGYFTAVAQATGETAAFWVDLSKAGLIDGGFNTASPSAAPSSVPITGAGLNTYFPAAKLGNGNYVYVQSGGTNDPAGAGGSGDSTMTWFLPPGINYFGIEAITSINYEGDTASNQAITVLQAYNIDKKIDDALPTTGSVTIFSTGWLGTGVPATTGTSTTCADARGNGAGWSTAVNTNLYSIEINGGAGLNCGLLFRFQ